MADKVVWAGRSRGLPEALRNKIDINGAIRKLYKDSREEPDLGL